MGRLTRHDQCFNLFAGYQWIAPMRNMAMWHIPCPRTFFEEKKAAAVVKGYIDKPL